MYHLGGNAFLGGFLVYVPVARLIISINLSYVPTDRVEGRKDKTWGRDRGIGLRCFSLTLSLFLSFYIYPQLYLAIYPFFPNSPPVDLLAY